MMANHRHFGLNKLFSVDRPGQVFQIFSYLGHVQIRIHAKCICAFIYASTLELHARVVNSSGKPQPQI